MMNKKTNVKQRTVIENILEKTEELIKIFVANIRTVEKKKKESFKVGHRIFLKQMKLNCGAQRHHYSMFNVGC